MYDYQHGDEDYFEAEPDLPAHRDLSVETAHFQVFGVSGTLWCAGMHLSQVLWFVGGLGIVLPLIMWMGARRKNPAIELHGRAIANWMLTQLCIFGVAGIAVFVDPHLAWPLAMVLLLLSITFPLLGTLYALSGIVWGYWFAADFLGQPMQPIPAEVTA